MIETMNEQYKHFICEMRECGLLYEINPSLPSPRLEINFYDNYESCFPLEFPYVVDASSTYLEEAFNPPLTS